MAGRYRVMVELGAGYWVTLYGPGGGVLAVSGIDAV
jgi:hypothetical protein